VASIYSNPFDPNGDGVTTGAEATNITSGVLPGGGGSVGAIGLDHVVDRHDGRSWNAPTSGRLVGDTNGTSGFMQYTAASSFTAGTLITAQAAGPLDSAMPFNLKLDGATVQSGAGAVNTHVYQVTALSNQSISQMRIEFPSMPTFGGNPSQHYGDFN